MECNSEDDFDLREIEFRLKSAQRFEKVAKSSQRGSKLSKQIPISPARGKRVESSSMNAINKREEKKVLLTPKKPDMGSTLKIENYSPQPKTPGSQRKKKLPLPSRNQPKIVDAFRKVENLKKSRQAEPGEITVLKEVRGNEKIPISKPSVAKTEYFSPKSNSNVRELDEQVQLSKNIKPNILPFDSSNKKLSQENEDKKSVVNNKKRPLETLTTDTGSRSIKVEEPRPIYKDSNVSYQYLPKSPPRNQKSYGGPSTKNNFEVSEEDLTRVQSESTSAKKKRKYANLPEIHSTCNIPIISEELSNARPLALGSECAETEPVIIPLQTHDQADDMNIVDAGSSLDRNTTDDLSDVPSAITPFPSLDKDETEGRIVQGKPVSVVRNLQKEACFDSPGRLGIQSFASLCSYESNIAEDDPLGGMVEIHDFSIKEDPEDSSLNDQTSIEQQIKHALEKSRKEKCSAIIQSIQTDITKENETSCSDLLDEGSSQKSEESPAQSQNSLHTPSQSQNTMESPVQSLELVNIQSLNENFRRKSTSNKEKVKVGDKYVLISLEPTPTNSQTLENKIDDIDGKETGVESYDATLRRVGENEADAFRCRVDLSTSLTLREVKKRLENELSARIQTNNCSVIVSLKDSE